VLNHVIVAGLDTRRDAAYAGEDSSSVAALQILYAESPRYRGSHRVAVIQ